MDIRSENLFLALLRKALWGGKLDLDARTVSDSELKEAINIARSQTVLGLVSNEVFSHPELSQCLQTGVKQQLMKLVQSNFLFSQMLNTTIINIVTELRKHSIDPILLKGQGIARCYPVPELRQCGDVDIYVGQEDFARTCDVIAGMSSSGDHSRDIASEKHYHTRIGHVFIEIHRYTDVYFPRRYDRIYQKISDEGINAQPVSVEFSGVPVSTPSLDFNVFFIFNHFWHHFIADGVGLRQICDWVLLLHSNYGKIDLEYLEDVLTKMDLLKEWQVFGCIGVDFLGLPQEEMPFYDVKYKKLARMVLDLIFIEGNFGKENLKGYKRPEGYVAGKWYSFRMRSMRNLRVLRLFPKEAIRHMFKVLFLGIAVMFSDKFSKYSD